VDAGYQSGGTFLPRVSIVGGLRKCPERQCRRPSPSRGRELSCPTSPPSRCSLVSHVGNDPLTSLCIRFRSEDSRTRHVARRTSIPHSVCCREQMQIAKQGSWSCTTVSRARVVSIRNVPVVGAQRRFTGLSDGWRWCYLEIIIISPPTQLTEFVYSPRAEHFFSAVCRAPRTVNLIGSNSARCFLIVARFGRLNQFEFRTHRARPIEYQTNDNTLVARAYALGNRYGRPCCSGVFLLRCPSC